MVINCQKLNEKTIGDAYPLPNICDILNQLGGANYFSVLDLASGFYQIPMDAEEGGGKPSTTQLNATALELFPVRKKRHLSPDGEYQWIGWEHEDF